MATDQWDAAEAALTEHGYDFVADDPFLSLVVALFRAIRGDADVATAMIEALTTREASEDIQDQAARHTASAFTAYARRDLREALEHATSAMTCVNEGLSFSGDDGRWTWPLAARAAHDLADHDTERSMLELGERQPIGHLAPVQRAELLLIRARLAVVDGSARPALFARAVAAHRTSGTPYHLAHALLDQAAHLASVRDHGAAAVAASEAREIAARLRCTPLDQRCDAVEGAATTLASPRPG
jgi:hypothetical protein